ncbi:MAG: putative periplasmic or secreted lipoprotein [Rhodospirillales bacterium]|jgi:osmotically-inducible protein OsmY|nr:putative periplasmic or secreted lipoprotein [Rhodospirillales bacterium]
MTALVRCWAALAALALSACSATGMAVGAGAATAVAASEERGIGGAISDTAIETQVNALLLQHDFETFRKVAVKSYEGRVLLTGQVQTPQMRLDAVRLAWQAGGVKEIINEIEVTDKGGAEAYARDVWISTQLRTKLLLDKEIKSINYSVETVGATVYLMGFARSPDELARVEAHARNLAYVRRVVSYVRIASEGG